MTGVRSCRLAVLASHPIQYFTPLYRLLAAVPGLDVEVMFYRDYGVRPRFDKQFGRPIQWDTDQLAGYQYRFLRNLSPITDTFTPLHAVNPGVITRLLRGFDAVWLNGYMYPSNWMALAAAALTGTRVLLRSELRLDDTPRRGTRARLRDTMIRSWIRWSDALLYIGRDNRDAYLAYGASPEKLFFSPYSVDVERIAAVASEQGPVRAALRRRWGIATNSVVLLFAGKLIERKHPEVMLRLAAHDWPTASVHVVIAGSGPLERALRAEAQQRRLTNISFLGFVNQRLLPEVYALGDIFVMPSDREPWGLVLNEATAARLAPVVSDAVGASADLITEGETGFGFRSGDWDALIGAVGSLVADPGLRARIAAGAQQRALRYCHEAAVRGIVQALMATGAMRAAGAAADGAARAG